VSPAVPSGQAGTVRVLDASSNAASSSLLNVAKTLSCCFASCHATPAALQLSTYKTTTKHGTEAMRRVVVTGLGAVSPLGIGVRQIWRRLLDGESGIVSTASLAPQDKWRALPNSIAGVVPPLSFHARDWVEPAEERRMSKFSLYAIAAAQMALRDAGWRPAADADREATGVCIGSGIGNLDDLYATSVAYEQEVRA